MSLEIIFTHRSFIIRNCVEESRWRELDALGDRDGAELDADVAVTTMRIVKPMS